MLSLSPEKVIFVFSEEIEPKFSAFMLYDAQGQLLHELAFTPAEGGLRVVIPLEQLSDGVYTVAWKVLSAIDGHITTGVGELSARVLLGTQVGVLWVLIKVALLMVIVAMAALNFRQVRRDGDYGQTELAPLQRRVWGEFFMILLVLGAAGALTLSPPAHLPTTAQGTEPPTVLVHETEGVRVTLTISSLRIGSAHFTVQLRDAQGQPISDVQRVTLEFLYSESAELGALFTIAQQNSAGDFEVHGSYLSLAGRWQIAVQVRLRDRLDDLRTLFEVTARIP